ncbi:MAG: hypothetical protein ACE5KE_08740 [Methanosarcinales archaeon]
MVYLDGVFQVNTSAEYYNATNLKEGMHTISTRTVDKSGNINLTWVNDTATTLSKWIEIKTDKKNYSLGENIVLGIVVNYTGPYVYAFFKLELQEPYGAPDTLIKTDFIPLKTGFYKTVKLTYPIPVTPFIPEGEYTFSLSLIDGFGNIIASDSTSFYINDTLQTLGLKSGLFKITIVSPEGPST